MRFRRAALEQAREGAAPAGSATPARPEPPAWLVELFGPETTRFSSQKLRALGWRPRVGFAEALRRTRSWLRDPSPEKPI